MVGDDDVNVGGAGGDSFPPSKCTAWTMWILWWIDEAI